MNSHIDMLFPVTYECHMPSVLCRKFCILSRVIIKCPKSAKKLVLCIETLRVHWFHPVLNPL